MCLTCGKGTKLDPLLSPSPAAVNPCHGALLVGRMKASNQRVSIANGIMCPLEHIMALTRMTLTVGKSAAASTVALAVVLAFRS
jgi:hypothetical protein